MEYVNLGRTGLKVSRICLGCMTYGKAPEGDPLTVGRHAWTLDEEESRPFFQQALDAGINFFDTANVYSSGASEVVLGRFLKEHVRREDVVVATKVQGVMRERPNGKGLSRKEILFELDQSLRRLETDYVDLYQIHRWDYETPIEETIEALHDAVKTGKVRTSEPPRCTLGSLRRRCTWRTGTAGRDSSPCRTTTTSFTGRKSGR